MAIKKITLTEDHLKLISNIRFEKFNFDEKQKLNRLKEYAFDLDLQPNSKDGEVSKNDFILGEISDFDGNERFGWGIDQWSLFGGTYVLEDVAMIIGKFDKVIPESIEEPTGCRFPPELEEYMYGLYNYIYDNMEYIISLVLFYSTRGGLTPGTYKCINNIKNWEKIE